MYSLEVKALAYTLDPECWVSYSGQPRKYKRYIEGRRVAALEKAQRFFNRQEESKMEIIHCPCQEPKQLTVRDLNPGDTFVYTDVLQVVGIYLVCDYSDSPSTNNRFPKNRARWLSERRQAHEYPIINLTHNIHKNCEQVNYDRPVVLVKAKLCVEEA